MRKADTLDFEQKLLLLQKTGKIYGLEKYLAQLNIDDWTGLLASNPREEFIDYLKDEMLLKLDWRFILKCISGKKSCNL